MIKYKSFTLIFSVDLVVSVRTVLRINRVYHINLFPMLFINDYIYPVRIIKNIAFFKLKSRVMIKPLWSSMLNMYLEVSSLFLFYAWYSFSEWSLVRNWIIFRWIWSFSDAHSLSEVLYFIVFRIWNVD